MSQSDMVIADQPGASFLADLNATIAALATCSSGATEPETTYAFQPWADTTADRLKIRNAANDGWVSVFVLSTGAPLGGAASGDNNDITRLLALVEVPTVIATAIAAGSSSIPTVRQTVLSGPVDTNGLSSFGGSTGGTTVTASGTLIATAANGTANRGGSITNPSWTSLSTNGTMYLYLDVAADGACTTGSTTLAPTYRWGGADVVTNNQFTFNIQEMVGKVGNGATAVQTHRVFVGEVTVAGAVVTAITWYALMGRYDSGFTATLPTAGVTSSKNHNIGIYPETAMLVAECTIIDGGYAVGDRIVGWMHGTNGTTSTTNVPFTTRLSVGITTNNGNPWGLPNKTGGAYAVINVASWKWKITAYRGW